MVDYDKQTELLDQEREKLEQANKHNEDLTKRLQNAIQQVLQQHPSIHHVKASVIYGWNRFRVTHKDLGAVS